MFKNIIIIAMLASLTASAQTADKKSDKLTFTSKTLLVESIEMPQHLGMAKPYSSMADGLSDIMNPLNAADIILDKVINMGQKVWNLVAKGKPVVNYSQFTASAMPMGVENWTQMQGWRAKSLTQEIVGKNKFGSEVVRFKYKVIFTYNGSVANVGKYIGYATVEPAHLRVGWGGFKVDVQVAVPQVFNMGTTENPIAGMKIQVRYAVDTIVVHDETTDSYILSGSGNVSAL